jgi:hypothetical protein
MANLSQRIYTGTPHKVCYLLSILPIPDAFAVSVSPSMKIEGAEKGVVSIHILFCLKDKNQKKNQLSSLDLQRLRANTAAQRMYSARRRYDARPHLHLPPLESLRHQFKRGRRMRRNRPPEARTDSTRSMPLSRHRLWNVKCRIFWINR